MCLGPSTTARRAYARDDTVAPALVMTALRNACALVILSVANAVSEVEGRIAGHVSRSLDYGASRLRSG